MNIDNEHLAAIVGDEKDGGQALYTADIKFKDNEIDIDHWDEVASEYQAVLKQQLIIELGMIVITEE